MQEVYSSLQEALLQASRDDELRMRRSSCWLVTRYY